MARIEPITPEQLPEDLRPVFEFAETTMGFTANDVMTMAIWPELIRSMQPVVAAIYGPGEVDSDLKKLVGHIVSAAAGCKYCQAHTAHGAGELGEVSSAKLAAVWEFETSPLFSTAERAALRVALGAGQQPNAVTDDDFQKLKEHFSERQIIEIVAVISLFGFLNRWNETLATQLEDTPLEFAKNTLSADRWNVGKHG